MAQNTFAATDGVAVREDQYIISATVSGVTLPKTFSWTSKEGGVVSSENTFTRPGGMQPGASLGGPSSRSDCTVKRQYTTALDPYISQLDEACGSARMSVSWQMQDSNGAPNGKLHTLTGVLKEVQVPNTDANATGASFLGLVMACDLQGSTT